MAIRLDFGKVRTVERTPQGGLRVPAFLTRTGIFVYKRADGTESRELRPPEEVFSPESMASLRGAPVTELHPPVLINAENWQTYARGNMGEDVRQEAGDFLGGDLYVQAAETVAKVEGGELVEISCGYDATIDPTPGVFNGEPYDAIQRRIRYNHVALGPVDWGRAGPDVRLRLDSADAIQQEPAGPRAPAKRPAPRAKRTDTMKIKFPQVTFGEGFATVRIDGVEYQLRGDEKGRAQAKSALEAAISRTMAQPRKDADEAVVASALEEAMGIVAGAQQQLMAAAIAAANPEPAAPTADEDDEEQITDEEEAEKKVSEEVLDSLVSKRLALLERAKQLAPAAKFDGKKEREIMEEAIKVAAPTMKLDSKTSPDFVRGVFYSLPVSSSSKRVDGGVGDLRTVVTPPAGGEERMDADELREKARKASREAYRKPLAASTVRK